MVFGILWAVIALAAASPAVARAPIAGDKVQSLDFMRLAMPGLVQTGDDYRAGRPMELRHISGDPNQRVEIAADTPITSPRTMLVLSGGRRRLVMMLDLGQPQDSAEGVALLALFDIEREPKLLDLANVGYDRQTGFFDPGKLMLPDGSTLLLIVSSHSNSNQTYQTYVMVDLHGDRLGLVDTFFLLNENGCGFESWQRPRFTAAGSRSKPAIQIGVTRTLTQRKEDCGTIQLPAPGTRKVTVTYTWQAASRRYVKSSDALERLAKENLEGL